MGLRPSVEGPAQSLVPDPGFRLHPGVPSGQNPISGLGGGGGLPFPTWAALEGHLQRQHFKSHLHEVEQEGQLALWASVWPKLPRCVASVAEVSFYMREGRCRVCLIFLNLPAVPQADPSSVYSFPALASRAGNGGQNSYMPSLGIWPGCIPAIHISK